jgi:hypothetical protein
MVIEVRGNYTSNHQRIGWMAGIIKIPSWVEYLNLMWNALDTKRSLTDLQLHALDTTPPSGTLDTIPPSLHQATGMRYTLHASGY